MNCRTRTALILSTFAMIVSTPTLAQDTKPAAESYTLDAVHSAVTFKIKHMGVGFTHGRFNKIEGKFTFDDANPDNAGSFEFTVQSESIDTNSQGRDDHLRKPEFFNVEKHPTITFKSTKVKLTGKHTYEVTGDMTLLGKTRPLTVTLKRIGAGKDPWGGYRTGFETSFTIKRSEFGMTEMLGPIGDEVYLTVAVEGGPQRPKGGRRPGQGREGSETQEADAG